MALGEHPEETPRGGRCQVHHSPGFRSVEWFGLSALRADPVGAHLGISLPTRPPKLRISPRAAPSAPPTGARPRCRRRHSAVRPPSSFTSAPGSRGAPRRWRRRGSARALALVSFSGGWVGPAARRRLPRQSG